MDLVGALVTMALGGRPAVRAPGRPGVDTHQTLLAVLGAAEQGGGRRGVAAELVRAWRGRAGRTGSREELTPVHGDPLAAVPVLVASAATLARPAWASWFTSGSVGNYALTTHAWNEILLLADDDRPAGRSSR